jgi:hypothetical protein
MGSSLHRDLAPVLQDRPVDAAMAPLPEQRPRREAARRNLQIAEAEALQRRRRRRRRRRR